MKFLKQMIVLVGLVLLTTPSKAQLTLTTPPPTWVVVSIDEAVDIKYEFTVSGATGTGTMEFSMYVDQQYVDDTGYIISEVEVRDDYHLYPILINGTFKFENSQLDIDENILGSWPSGATACIFSFFTTLVVAGHGSSSFDSTSGRYP